MKDRGGSGGWLRGGLFLLAWVSLALLAFPTVSADEDAPADPDDHTLPSTSMTEGAEPGTPGMLGTEPTAKGLLYKRLTRIDPLEWNSPDPAYRWALRQIDAGVADARVMRLYHWLKPRLAPYDRPIPEGWRQAALERQLQGPRESAGADGPGNDAATLPATGRWVPVGPTTIPGRVTGLSRVAGREGWLLAGMADGGAWLTKDHGQNWEALTEREATHASGAVAVDPSDPDTLYWATGEGNGAADNYGGIGVLRSHDGGRTWTASERFSSTFRCLKVDPADHQRLWACGGSGIYRSDDGGANWVQVEGGLPTDAGGTDLIFRPGDPSVIFAGIWGRGVWKSSDGGGAWSQVEGGLPADLGRNVLAACEADPDVMVVASGVNSGDVWRSTDGGSNWAVTAGDPNHCGGQCWYDNAVAIAPDDCQTIYADGVGFHVSRDGGVSWGGTGSSIHVDHHAILAGAGGEVIVGDDGGVYRSTDWGASFSNISTGLFTTQYYGACGSDVTDGELMGGTQDRGSHQLRPGEEWRIVLGGDGGMCAIGGQRLLGEYQNTNLRRSIDGGNSFQDANAGIKVDDPKSWVGIIEKDPSDPRTLYVGTNRVYRTTDFHDSIWDDILGPVYFGRMVTSLAVSPADRNVLWVGYELGGLYRTTEALAPGFPKFDDVKGSLPNRNVRRVVPDRTDPTTAWIVLSGYGYPKLMFTADAGTNYSDVTGDMPDVPVNDLVVDPGDTQVLFAATDLGIYRSADGGAHWTGFSDGLPLAAVTDLFVHPADQTLIASTHGRSMFRLQEVSPDAVAVPDGATVPGEELIAKRTEGGDLWLRYDTLTCTAARYNLFYGALADVAAGPYEGAECGLSRGGEDEVTMPGAAGENLFFAVAGASESGVEGPHGYRSDGSARPHSGEGFCGIALHQEAASCP